MIGNIHYASQRELWQLKVMAMMLAGALIAGGIQSCSRKNSNTQSSSDEKDAEAADKKQGPKDAKEPSPDIEEIEVKDLGEVQLDAGETSLRDKVAREVCINDAGIKSALEDFTCRIKEQMRWLGHDELYQASGGKCRTLASKYHKKYVVVSDGAWLEDSCKKIASYGFVELAYQKRKEGGKPVTEQELREKVQELLAREDYEKLKKGEKTTHLEGLLRFNTYGLNEKCSADLRYDFHAAVVEEGDFSVKPVLFAAHALSDPVKDFMTRFRGHTVSSQANQSISGKKFTFTATGVGTDGTTATITLSQTATATIAAASATTATIVGTIASQLDAVNANHPSDNPSSAGDKANADVSLKLNHPSPPPPTRLLRVQLTILLSRSLWRSAL